MGDIYDEDAHWWVAGYRDEEGNYFNIQEESRAVDYNYGDVTVDWERFEDFNDRYDLTDDLMESDYTVIGWIGDNGEAHYATLVDGVDLDLFDFEVWLEDHDEADYGGSDAS